MPREKQEKVVWCRPEGVFSEAVRLECVTATYRPVISYILVAEAGIGGCCCWSGTGMLGAVQAA